MALTKDQSKAKDLIGRWLSSRFGKRRGGAFLLRGSAGTGKTFMIQELTGMVKGPEFVVASAPTHKAVKVLASRVGNEIACMTIHRFLGLRPMKHKGKTVLRRRKDYDPTEFQGIGLVVLDEASMTNQEIWDFIQKDMEEWDRCYLFSGDFYQLPPPDELYSVLSEVDFGEWQIELIETVRQVEGNPIITAATEIRNAIISKREPKIITGKNEQGSVQLLKPKDWEKALYAVSEKAGNDQDYYRILAYRNIKVREYNQFIRGVMGYDLSLPFTKGEQVVANEPFVEGEDILMNTGAEFVVEGLVPYTHLLHPELKGWTVSLKHLDTGEDFDFDVPVLDWEKCEQAYYGLIKQRMDAALNNGDWRPYYALKEHFCDIRPLHSITCHKGQGSTFTHAFPDMRDIYTCRPQSTADRCLYVAMTRPRLNVFLVA